MGEVRATFTGFKAVVVIVAIGAFAVFRLVSATTSIETDAAAELKFWLRGEYSSWYLAENPSATAGLAERLLVLDKIEFTELDARGAPSDMAIRVNISVDGNAPPFGDSVRYFRMEYSQLTGWKLTRETTRLGYYLASF